MPIEDLIVSPATTTTTIEEATPVPSSIPAPYQPPYPQPLTDVATGLTPDENLRPVPEDDETSQTSQTSQSSKGSKGRKRKSKSGRWTLAPMVGDGSNIPPLPEPETPVQRPRQEMHDPDLEELMQVDEHIEQDPPQREQPPDISFPREQSSPTRTLSGRELKLTPRNFIPPLWDQ